MSDMLYAWKWDRPAAYVVVKRWAKQLDIQTWLGFKHRIRAAQIGAEYFESIDEARESELKRIDSQIEHLKDQLQRLRSRRGQVENFKP